MTTPRPQLCVACFSGDHQQCLGGACACIHTPALAGETPRAEETARDFYRARTEDELRKVLSMLCHFVWHRQTRPGEHMWSIPVDKDRDFDCILSDAISELTALRQQVKALRRERDDYREAYRHANESVSSAYTRYQQSRSTGEEK